MNSPIPRSIQLLMTILIALTCGCEKKPKAASASTAERPAKLLAGEITESILPEIGYKRIADSSGASIQDGVEPPYEILRQDIARYKPLAVQWAGIKSLEPIPGKGNNLFFRYNLIAELYPNAESAKRRDDEFDSVYAEHIERDGHGVAKEVIRVLRFAHERVFYLLITDMSASSDQTEAGRLKFALVKHLTE